MNITDTIAGPAWNAYLLALKTLENAETSYKFYSERDLGPDATDEDVRRAGAMTSAASLAATCARTSLIEARRAYTLAVELEDQV